MMLRKILINGGMSVLIVFILFADFALGEEAISSNMEEQSRISNVWFEADLCSAFQDLASQSGITILVDDYVEGLITLSLENVTIDEAIKTICMKGGYDYKKLKDDLYIIGSVDPNSPTFQKHALTKKIELNYADSKDIVTLLKHYTPYISAVGRTIIIRAWPNLANKIEKDVKMLDKPPRQVQGKVVIVELTEEARFELGLDTLEYGTNGEKEWSLSLEPGKVGLSITDAYKFMMKLKALERKGEASLRASTNITVPEGKKATISLGKEMRIVIEKEEEYYRIEKVRAETSLTLGVQRVTSNNEIIFTYEVKAGDIAEEVPKITQIPVVYERSAQGTAVVSNNTAFVIGGLTREVKRSIRGAIPPAKTKVTEKMDLIVVVLPHIVGTAMPKPKILEKKLERMAKKPEIKEKFNYSISLHANYFWSKMNDFVKKKGYSSFDPMIFYEGQLHLAHCFALFANTGRNKIGDGKLNMTSYGVLLKKELLLKKLEFFLGVGLANGELNLGGDKYTLNSYTLKAGLQLKLGILNLGGGYNYFPRQWKKNGPVEKGIDSSGIYSYIGLYIQF